MTENFIRTQMPDNIPIFEGTNNESAMKWKQRMSSLLDIITVPDQGTAAQTNAHRLKVQKYVLTQGLKRGALAWFDALPAGQRDTLPHIWTAFTNKYINGRLQYMQRMRLEQMKQLPTDDVATYAYKLQEQITETDPTMSIEARIVKFIMGLQEPVMSTLIERTFNTYEEAVNAAIRKEASQRVKKRRKEEAAMTKRRIRNEAIYRIKEIDNEIDKDKEDSTLTLTQEIKELKDQVRMISDMATRTNLKNERIAEKRTYPQQNNFRTNKRRNIQCFHCQKTGHIRNECWILYPRLREDARWKGIGRKEEERGERTRKP